MKKVINDLYDYGLKIYQDKDSFKFSLDSILLAEFVRFKKSTTRIVDFCTGNAVIPLILSIKIGFIVEGIEIQDCVWKLAQANIKINKLRDRIKIYNGDVNGVKEMYGSETVDIVTCNPPYFKVESTRLKNDNWSKAIARHELKINLDSIVKNASYILKNRGEFYLVHRPERLDEIFMIMQKYKLIVKTIQFIYSKSGENAIMVLIRAVKNGHFGLKVLSAVDVSGMESYKNKVGEKNEISSGFGKSGEKL